MRIIVRPVAEPQRELDITQRLVAAIAEELWRLYGGNDGLNWLEAEVHLRAIIGQTRAEATVAGSGAPETRVELPRPSSPEPAGTAGEPQGRPARRTRRPAASSRRYRRREGCTIASAT